MPHEYISKFNTRQHLRTDDCISLIDNYLCAKFRILDELLPMFILYTKLVPCSPYKLAAVYSTIIIGVFQKASLCHLVYECPEVNDLYAIKWDRDAII
jgi:hypothetical protein